MLIGKCFYITIPAPNPTIWIQLVPLKVTCFVWHACLAKEIIEWILVQCGLPPQHFSELVNLVKFAASWGRCTKKRKLLVAICYGFIWCTWKARNDRLFNNTITSAGKLKDNIALLVFDWIQHRGSFKNCNLATWCNSPLNIL